MSIDSGLETDEEVADDGLEPGEDESSGVLLELGVHVLDSNASIKLSNYWILSSSG